MVARLSGAFAHYDQADVWQALAVTMDLFRKVSLETAGLLEYSYPADGAEYAAELVNRLSQGRSLTDNRGQLLISKTQKAAVRRK